MMSRTQPTIVLHFTGEAGSDISLLRRWKRDWYDPSNAYPVFIRWNGPSLDALRAVVASSAGAVADRLRMRDASISKAETAVSVLDAFWRREHRLRSLAASETRAYASECIVDILLDLEPTGAILREWREAYRRASQFGAREDADGRRLLDRAADLIKCRHAKRFVVVADGAGARSAVAALQSLQHSALGTAIVDAVVLRAPLWAALDIAAIQRPLTVGGVECLLVDVAKQARSAPFAEPTFVESWCLFANLVTQRLLEPGLGTVATAAAARSLGALAKCELAELSVGEASVVNADATLTDVRSWRYLQSRL